MSCIHITIPIFLYSFIFPFSWLCRWHGKNCLHRTLCRRDLRCFTVLLLRSASGSGKIIKERFEKCLEHFEREGWGSVVQSVWAFSRTSGFCLAREKEYLCEHLVWFSQTNLNEVLLVEIYASPRRNTHTPMPIASEVKKLMVRKLERDPLGAVDSTAGPSEVATQLTWGERKT